MEKEAKIIIETEFFVHQSRVSAVKRVEFVSDTMSYITISFSFMLLMIIYWAEA
jgi:hypothetical protein